MHTLKEMKAAIRALLAANPALEGESDKRLLLREHCPFNRSSVRYKEWTNAVQSVLREKPPEKLRRTAEDTPEHLREWAARNDLLK